jgi:two-component system NarL family response regulator
MTHRTTRSSPAKKSPHRVLVADDHAIVRDGLSLIIGAIAGVEIAGEAADGKEAMAQFRALKPDLMVLDLRMPEADGLDVVRTLLAERPDARILIVTTYDTDEDIYNSLRAGARGYLLKDSPREIIMEAVQEVLAGGTYTPAHIATKLVSRLGSSPLSARELDVLRLVADGRTNKEIGAQLSIGGGTVKTHLANLLAKLDAHSRTEAVARARQRGYLMA